MFIGISTSAKLWGQEIAKDVLVMGWVVWMEYREHRHRLVHTHIHTYTHTHIHTYTHILGTVGAERLTQKRDGLFGEGNLL